MLSFQIQWRYVDETRTYTEIVWARSAIQARQKFQQDHANEVIVSVRGA